MANEALKNYLDAQFQSVTVTMATKDYIESLSAIITKREERIATLESKIVFLEKHAEALSRNVNDQEQYNRRFCLRIN